MITWKVYVWKRENGEWIRVALTNYTDEAQEIARLLQDANPDDEYGYGLDESDVTSVED